MTSAYVQHVRSVCVRTGAVLIAVAVATWLVTVLLVYTTLPAGGRLTSILIASGSFDGVLVMCSGITMTSLGRPVTGQWINLERIRRGVRVLLLLWILTVVMLVLIGRGVLTLADIANALQVTSYVFIPVLAVGSTGAAYFVARSAVSRINER